jgi:drug/metabolite transporter (DMT)-like permease
MTAIAERFNALPGPLRGVFWMALQVICMAALYAVVRKLTFYMPATEAAFFRGFMGLLVMLPWLMRQRLVNLWPRQWGFVTLRSALSSFGIICWFWALSGLPVTDVIAIQFTHPLFVIVGAALILREAVGPRRWLAVAIGFVGMLVIIRPGMIPFNILILGALGSALSNSGVQIVTKHIAGGVSGGLLAFYMNLFLTPVALILALDGWVWPSWEALPWLIPVGLLGTLAHIFLTRALACADASLVGPLDFVRLPIAALFGWLLFKEFSDLWTCVGAGVIIASVITITRREAGDAAAREKAGRETRDRK